jgi:hypothetical protein
MGVLSQEIPEVIDRPSNSSGTNPVENLWSIIKHRVEIPKPTTD